MRLIDADAIQFENNEFDTYSDYSRAFDAIDQAPTIKTFTLADIEEQYRKGLEKGLEKRPHGEWKNGMCTNCGAECFEDDYMRDIKTEFCHRCGADMRTKEGDEK